MKTLALSALFLAGLLVACDFDSLTVEVQTPACPDPLPVYDYRDAERADTTWTPLGCPYAYVTESGDTIVVGEPIPEGM